MHDWSSDQSSDQTSDSSPSGDYWLFDGGIGHPEAPYPATIQSRLHTQSCDTGIMGRSFDSLNELGSWSKKTEGGGYLASGSTAQNPWQNNNSSAVQTTSRTVRPRPQSSPQSKDGKKSSNGSETPARCGQCKSVLVYSGLASVNLKSLELSHS
jgi:hypothetical protein